MLSLPLQLFKKYIVVFFILSIVGFVDASFLAVEHYMGKIPPCSLTNGCEKVTTSDYSVIFGVPVALAGALYYLSLIVLLILFLDIKKPIFIKIFISLTGLGFISSIFFTYLQFFVIKAICPYCLLSAFTSTSLFFLSLWCARRNEARDNTL